MTSLRDRFPFSSKLILIAGLPWVLRPVFKILMSLIPESHAAAIKDINMDDLNQYIDENQVSTTMGGTSKTKFQVVPRHSKSCSEFDCFSPSAANKLKKHVASYTNPDEYEIVETLKVIQ